MPYKTIMRLSDVAGNPANGFPPRLLGASLSGIFVDYGQPAVQSEWEAAQRIANHYQIEIEKVDLN